MGLTKVPRGAVFWAPLWLTLQTTQQGQAFGSLASVHSLTPQPKDWKAVKSLPGTNPLASLAPCPTLEWASLPMASEPASSPSFCQVAMGFLSTRDSHRRKPHTTLGQEPSSHRECQALAETASAVYSPFTGPSPRPHCSTYLSSYKQAHMSPALATGCPAKLASKCQKVGYTLPPTREEQ